MSTTSPFGLFYGSSTCYTEIAAEKIRDILGAERIDLHNIANSTVEDLLNYSVLVLGIPTWDYGELQEDWEDCWDELSTLDLRGKTVALFGLGDQVGYPQWFLDAMGYLHDLVLSRGARAIGYWPVEGYQFESSKALSEDGRHFVGLALDEENEFDLSDERLRTWCAQILAELHG